MKRLVLLLAALCAVPAVAQQTTGQLVQTIQSDLAANNANEINALALQNVLQIMNLSYCNVYLCQLQGQLQTFPSSGMSAGLNIPVGVAPAAPNSGDVWMAANGLTYKFGSEQQIVPVAAKGSCTMTSGACAAQSFSTQGITYALAPTCTCSWSGTGTLAGALKCPNTQTTITPASSNSGDTAAISWICVGN